MQRLDGGRGLEHKPVSAPVKAAVGPTSEVRGAAFFGGFLYDTGKMKELLRTNDYVLLSYADALLRDAGIDAVQLDSHTSILEGSIGAIPRRLMVPDADHAAAQALIDQAMADVAAGLTIEETSE